MPLIVVTGGARSGKSRFAEARLAELAPGGPWLYLATADAGDDEMRARIARHRARRGPAFRTVEAPREIVPALAAAGDARAAIIDCITIWLSNRMLAGDDDDALLAAVDELAACARALAIPVVAVTNEVGGGIVPEHPLARRFRDLAGLANQRLAAAAVEVVLVAAGLPLRLR
jgi:adenosylcobinamide kinase/adenosylcobinamide-phosphate guanylyltransferase